MALAFGAQAFGSVRDYGDYGFWKQALDTLKFSVFWLRQWPRWNFLQVISCPSRMDVEDYPKFADAFFTKYPEQSWGVWRRVYAPDIHASEIAAMLHCFPLTNPSQAKHDPTKADTEHRHDHEHRP
jgi:hypothetical protein